MFDRLVLEIQMAQMDGFGAAGWRVTQAEAEQIANRICGRLADLIAEGRADVELDGVPLAQLLSGTLIELRKTRFFRAGGSR